MDREPFCYPPLRLSTPFVESAAWQEGALAYPNTRPLRAVVNEVGFFATRQGRAVLTAALRGSTATFYSDAGFRFRHPKSDIDIVAMTDDVDLRGGARYLFYTVASLPPLPRDLDILCFSPARLAAEQASRRRIFLTTKLIQPGVPVVNGPLYEQLKLQALATLIVRGAVRRQISRVTPSGAARLVLEEDLFAEPWRWLSLRTYYMEAPSAARQRMRLTCFAHMALQRLAAHGQGREITPAYAMPDEPVYELALPAWRYGPLLAERERAIQGFVYDQFSILLRSGGKSFTPDKAVSFMLKAISLSKNPLLRFDADLVFEGSVAHGG